MNMMYLAPAICLIFGIVGIIQTIRFYKKWGNIKLSTLIIAIVWIPAFIALLLQILGVIDNDHLAKALGPQYMIERANQMKKTDTNTPVDLDETTPNTNEIEE